MDTTTQVTISSLSTRKANGQRGEFTVYEIVDSNNTRWQAKKDLFDQAAQLVGQTVSFVGNAKQNGTFTNFYVNAIVGGVPATQAQPAPAPTAPAPVPAPVNDAEERKQQAIQRQTAGKVAAVLSNTADEFWSHVTDLAHYFDTGETPASRLAQTADAEILAIAKAANETNPYPVAAAPNNTDDDIPF